MLIAIDSYPQGLKTSLSGCVQGAKEIENFIRTAINNQAIFDSAEIHNLFDADATSERIFSKLKELVEKSHPEDILLIYFSGHANNSSFEENVIIPYDYQSEIAEQKQQVEANGISNKIFLEKLRSFKAVAERGQVVLVLDTHTGYYKWVEDADIFIGGVNNTPQTEFKIGEKTSSAFSDAIKQVLDLTKGRIYHDLFNLTKYKVENEYNQAKESPVMLVSEETGTIIPTQETVPNQDGYLLYHNQNVREWQVIPPSFAAISSGRPMTFRLPYQ